MRHEVSGGVGIGEQRQLHEILQKRHFTDLSEQIPGQDESSDFHLPAQPDTTTVLRHLTRITGKRSAPLVESERRNATDDMQPSRRPRSEASYEIPADLRADPEPEEQDEDPDEEMWVPLLT